MDFETTAARARLEKMLCTTDMDPTKLPLSLLKEITNNFSDDQQIGSGGFATVYKGLLKNGTIAVKKLKNVIMDDTNFNTEVVDNWKTRIEASDGDTKWLEQVRLCVEIGIKCSDLDADKRPDARQIIEWLDETEHSIGFVANEIPTLATQVRSLGLSENSKLLDIEPLELRFPLEQEQHSSIPVSLTNRTDHYVGVWITPTDHSALPVLLEHKPLRGPVFQMVEPRSTLALGITLEKQRSIRLPTDIILIRKRKQATKKGTLEVVMAVMGSKERLEMLKSFIDSMPHVNRYMLRIVDVVMVVMESTECLKKLKSYFAPRNWKALLQTMEDKMVAIGSRERVDSLRLYVCRMFNMQGDEVLKRMELLGGRVHRETLTVVATASDDDDDDCQQAAAVIHDMDTKFISTSVFGEASGMDVHPTKPWY
nr:unnamed protein product [Digitaria exilis]